MGTHDLTRSLKIIFHTMIEDLSDKLYYVETDFAKSKIVLSTIASNRFVVMIIFVNAVTRFKSV